VKVENGIRQLQALADSERAAGRRIALVPTMGALHAGHLSLVSEASKRADRVWVSIFVNPCQFEQRADFEGYPRELERDLEACRRAAVDVVFAPRADEFYPPGFQTWVELEALTQPLCGASRPGHFRGVTTVVTKLLLAAKPDLAVFGEKDFQQLAVIRRLVRDLGFDTEVLGVPILREPDGLALSSRNVHLGPRARQQALALVRTLDKVEQAVGEGERSRDRLLALVSRQLGRIERGEVDYAELRDPETLELAPPRLGGPTLLALAVRFLRDADGRGAEVRLIDNRVLLAGRTPEACA